ncbi:hypothetical protein NIES2109_47390 [Nostoc sp. HK-01]|uniref:Uncharacterized protein n=1 Tax=Anabaenopsis circularis NIES-21 TaxID=1085406 RepID=A0A1Z4GPP5_9CYAN|nr:hypothetical protein NIES21_53090 [Anabaenopsis circularis NIES-21]BBD61903.1 hypothetical protein NIES2109_47390 [Nostoc sp. HK-01]
MVDYLLQEFLVVNQSVSLLVFVLNQYQEL